MELNASNLQQWHVCISPLVDILWPDWKAELSMVSRGAGPIACQLTEGCDEKTAVKVSMVSDATRPANTADALHPLTDSSDSMCD